MKSSFFYMVDINGESILHSSSSFLESLIIQFFSSKPSDTHVSWLIGQVLVTQLARTLSDDPVMERLRLIELLSVLRSILISVSIFFRCPASAIPQRWVHYISRAIIEKGLSWSVQICLIRHMLVELNCFFLGEFSLRITVSEDRFRLLLWIDVTSSESSLIRCILWVIIWMSLRHSFSAISPWGRVQRIICLRNPFGIESSTK